MRTFGRFLHRDTLVYGEVRERGSALPGAAVLARPELTGETRSLGELAIDVPVAPSKIIAVGLNYRDHIKEMQRTEIGSPLIWFKAPSSLLPHNGTIRIAFPEHKTDFETELAVVIGSDREERQSSSAPSITFSATRSRRTSAIAICRNQKSNFRAANLSIPTRRWDRSFTPKLKPATWKFRCAKTAK